MPRWFIKYRSESDESAPLDYTYVGSVAEGARRLHAEPIHREVSDATVSRRATPDEAPLIDDYRAHRAPARRDEPTAAGQLPSAANGPAPAARVAYPRPRNNAFAETPTFAPRGRQRDDTPYDWSASRARTSDTSPDALAVKNERRQAAQNAPFTQPQQATQNTQFTQPQIDMQNTQHVQPQQATQNTQFTQPQQATQFAPPVSPDMPDWLRIAQQNRVPLQDERMRRAPRVQAAPRVEPPTPAPTDLLGRPLRNAPKPQPAQVLPQDASGYAAAGYPPELIEQQRLEEQRQREQARRMRHGAQYAVNPERLERERLAAQQPTVDPRSYPPPRSAIDRDRATRRRAETQAAYSDPAIDEQRVTDALYQPGAPDDPRVNPFAVSRERWQDDEAEDEQALQERPNVPWLGIAVVVMALLCVGLWIARMSFENRTNVVLLAREQQSASQFDDHPYRYRELIEAQAGANNLHPAFVAAIVLNESSFNPSAESNIGARGLMQMTEETFDFVHKKLSGDAQTTFDAMYEADTNVRYACWYLAFLSDRFHADPILVAAAFHAGPNTVQNWLNDSRYSADSRSITLENMMDGPTKNYATRVLNAYAVYKRLYYETIAGGTTL